MTSDQQSPLQRKRLHPGGAVDFSRSFGQIRLDLNVTRPKTVSQTPPFTLNNARFPAECYCRIEYHNAAETFEYVLGASCKAEQVNVKEDIWHEPAADMCLVASPDEFLVIKSWDRNNRGVMLSPPSLGPQPERQAGKNSEAFTRLTIYLRPAKAKLLTRTADIVDAVLQNVPLVSETEYSMPDGTRVFLQYPTKVINASEREMFYQVDTGPILVPDPTAYDGVHRISMLRLAFAAYNSLGCTEFLVNVPTPITGEMSVNHYSRVLKLSATNRTYSLD